MRNYKKSNRKGFGLEEYVVSKIYPFDNTVKPTKNSGANGSIGDISSKYFYCECKQQLTTEHPKINRNTWYKLVSNVPRGDKVPVLVLENNKNDKFAILNLDTFFDLMKEYFNHKE